MATTSQSTADFVYKKKYAELTAVTVRKHKTLDKMRKVYSLGGSDLSYSVQYGDGQGAGAGSANFSGIQANVSPVKGTKFAMSAKVNYQLAQIDGPSIALSKGSASAFDSLVTRELKSSLNAFQDTLGFQLFRDGTGARGTRASASTNVITLTRAADVRNFHVGMTVVAGTSTTSLRTGSTTVTGKSVLNKTVTLTSAAAITSFADGDILFRQYETGNSLMEGMDAINPLTAPEQGSDSFRGVDRGVAAELLAGSRLNDTGNTIEENANLVATQIADLGGEVDTLILSPANATAFTNRFSARIQTEGGGKAKFGFKDGLISSPAGDLEVIADPDCPADRGRLIKMDDWEICYSGPDLIHSTYDDMGEKRSGNFWFPMGSSDAIEGRWRSIANVRCLDTRNMGVFAI